MALILQEVRIPASFSMHKTRLSKEDDLMQYTERRKAITIKL